MKQTGAIEKYQNLRNKIDQLSSQLQTEHGEHMKCQKGCAECCMNFDLLPVEFFSIKTALANDEKKVVSQKNNDGCLFLEKDVCTIYEHRPIICRTHGLPLLYVGNSDEWELSYCPLNFEEVELDFFHFENTFPQDRFNSNLYLINQLFLQENPELDCKSQLISMNLLVKSSDSM